MILGPPAQRCKDGPRGWQGGERNGVLHGRGRADVREGAGRLDPRAPDAQSAQSVAYAQWLHSEPGPPSWQAPSDKAQLIGHVLRHPSSPRAVPTIRPSISTTVPREPREAMRAQPPARDEASAASRAGGSRCSCRAPIE